MSQKGSLEARINNLEAKRAKHGILDHPSLIFAIIMQTAVGIWWASSIDSNIHELKENAVTRNQMLEEKAKVMNDINRRHSAMSERVTRVEEKFAFIEKSLIRLEMLLEGKK